MNLQEIFDQLTYGELSQLSIGGGEVGVISVANYPRVPDSHLEPLLLFVASRATTPMGVGQFEGLAGNNYYAKYEKACHDIETMNLQVDQGSQNTRLESKGWV